MRYSVFVQFKRIEEVVNGKIHARLCAIRVSKAHGHTTEANVSFATLYRGHCSWVGEQIEANEARKHANAAKRAA